MRSPLLLFHWLWLVYIAWYLLVGVSAAMLGALFLAGHSYSAGVLGVAIAVACSVLCGVAQESRRELSRFR